MSEKRLDELSGLWHASDGDDADLAYMLAVEHLKRGDAVLAMTFIGACLAIDPGYTQAYFHKAKALLRLASDAAEEGRDRENEKANPNLAVAEELRVLGVFIERAINAP